VKTGKEIRQFVGHTKFVLNVTYSRDGKYIVTGSGDKTARVWDAATGQEVRKFTWEIDTLAGVGFSPDGRYVLVCASGYGCQTGQEVRQFEWHSDIIIAFPMTANPSDR
jgi:WD40 repeat protein